MTTARAVYHHCRKAGIILSADGDKIMFDTPATVTVPVDDLRRCKAELLAVLQGNYLVAAMHLALNVADPDRRIELVAMFDERVTIHQRIGNLSRGESERAAYIKLARTLEKPRVAATESDVRAYA